MIFYMIRAKRKVQELEEELAAYEAKLAEPEIYGNVSSLTDFTLKFEKTKKELDAKNETWEQLMEQVETLENQLKG